MEGYIYIKSSASAAAATAVTAATTESTMKLMAENLIFAITSPPNTFLNGLDHFSCKNNGGGEQPTNKLGKLIFCAFDFLRANKPLLLWHFQFVLHSFCLKWLNASEFFVFLSLFLSFFTTLATHKYIYLFAGMDEKCGTNFCEKIDVDKFGAKRK